MQNKLIQIDDLLALIPVKGEDTFTMVRARSLLKEVFDEVKRESAIKAAEAKKLADTREEI